MKISTIYLDKNKIEIYNTLLGDETIKVNGETVSNKYSITGAEHVFPIIENGKTVNCSIRLGLGLSGVVYDLHKDRQPIIESTRGSFMRLFIGALFVGILIGIAIGFVLE